MFRKEPATSGASLYMMLPIMHLHIVIIMINIAKKIFSYYFKFLVKNSASLSHGIMFLGWP